MQVKLKKCSPLAVIPAYQTPGSAACDLCAAIPEPLVLEPGEIRLIPTGVAIDCGDPDVAILLFARSGLAVKHGIALANGVGVVDSDYRGEIRVGLINQSALPYTLNPGERIAQMLFTPVIHAEFLETDALSDTERGSGGFGHTGR